MNRPSDPVPVATTAPLLRLVLILVPVFGVLVGVLMMASTRIRLAALGLAMLVVPVLTAVEGYRRNRRSSQFSAARRAPADETGSRPGHREHPERDLGVDQPLELVEAWRGDAERPGQIWRDLQALEQQLHDE